MLTRYYFFPALLCAAFILTTISLPCFAEDTASHSNENTPAKDSSPSVEQVFNIFKFVSWPEDVEKSERFVFCTLGDNPFGASLYKNTAQNIQGKPVRVITDVSLGFAAYCHALYVKDYPFNREHIGPLLDSLHKKPVLTVSDITGFVAAGGMVEIHPQSGDKLTLSVNQDTATVASLRISSKLLTLSK